MFLWNFEAANYQEFYFIENSNQILLKKSNIS